MNTIYPNKLQQGDKIAVIAPVRSLSLISEDLRNIAKRRFNDIGLELVFGKYVEESDDFRSTTVEHRLEDLHWAFGDPKIKGILTVIGGFNSNQLLQYIDWDIIRSNPKVFCGFSDVTALNNSILAKTGLVTYSGPHYSTFGQELHFEYTLKYFKKTLMSDDIIEVEASKEWSDDIWYKDQNNRNLVPNEGFLNLNSGNAKGKIIGGNISTFNLLQGTEFMPSLEDSILFLEDDEETYPADLDRRLQSIIHLPDFNKVKGLAIGRFQKISEITSDVLEKIISSKKELQNIPVVANLDFGHTDPKITLPIGGEAEISIDENGSTIRILRH